MMVGGRGGVGSCWVVLAPGQRGVFIHPAPKHGGGGRPGEEQPWNHPPGSRMLVLLQKLRRQTDFYPEKHILSR